MNPDTRSFDGILAGEMMDFLRHQRALGKRFVNEERGLRLFDHYLVEQKVGAIEEVTPEVIEAFLASRPRARAAVTRSEPTTSCDGCPSDVSF